MLKKRLIPIIYIKNGRIVQSKQFNRHQVLGAHIEIFKRLNSWNADEVIILDISRDKSYSLNRSDLSYSNLNDFSEIISQISKHCFMPLSVGGGIRSFEVMEKMLNLGADKLIINYLIDNDEQLIKKSILSFGSQCMIASIDVKKFDGKFFPMHSFGKIIIDTSLEDYIKKIEDLGFGEIFLNSIDRDGTGLGFDIDLINSTLRITSKPLIVAGGAGKFEDFELLFTFDKLSAIGAGNIFNYTENSYMNIKDYLKNLDLNIRII